MNRIGSTASGGIIDITVMKGDSVALTSGRCARRDARHQRDHRAEHEADAKPPEARHRVVPQQIFAGAFVLGERDLH